MRVLVAIANYGTKNDGYLARLLREYRSMPYDVQVVVLSNIQKDLGDDVELFIHQPQGNPWSFPFAHKRILADRAEDYDLFIYSEDDTLITAKNIEAFLQVNEVLPENEIPGFMRSEARADGVINFSTVHAHFHWDPRSVVARGPYTFAFFTNDHSASYVLTRRQLKRAIESGGFLVEPHQDRYDLLVTAATDPYTQCGFRKVICVSHLKDFVLPHLPNKYVRSLGLPSADFSRQIQALQAIAEGARPCTTLLNGETKVGELRWSKSYYEQANPEVLAAVPSAARTVLSFGCGWGAMEADLARAGLQVTGVALDSVIGACAEARGIEMVYGDPETACAQLCGRKFDCLLISNILHLVPEPDRLLSSLNELLSPGGSMLAIVPNLAQLPVLWGRLKGDPTIENLGSYARAGTHAASYRMVRSWFDRAGLKVRGVVPSIPERAQKVHRITGAFSSRWLASDFLIVAIKSGSLAPAGESEGEDEVSARSSPVQQREVAVR